MSDQQLRYVEILQEDGTWVRGRFSDIVIDDQVRIYEPDGTFVGAFSITGIKMEVDSSTNSDTAYVTLKCDLTALDTITFDIDLSTSET